MNYGKLCGDLLDYNEKIRYVAEAEDDDGSRNIRT